MQWNSVQQELKKATLFFYRLGGMLSLSLSLNLLLKTRFPPNNKLHNNNAICDDGDGDDDDFNTKML